MMICKNCGTQSEGENQDPRGKGIGASLLILGSIIIFFAVFLYWMESSMGCLPILFGFGCFGTGWWLMKRRPPIKCNACQVTGSMVPLDTPMGIELAHRFNQPFNK